MVPSSASFTRRSAFSSVRSVTLTPPAPPPVARSSAPRTAGRVSAAASTKPSSAACPPGIGWSEIEAHRARRPASGLTISSAASPLAAELRRRAPPSPRPATSSACGHDPGQLRLGAGVDLGDARARQDVVELVDHQQCASSGSSDAGCGAAEQVRRRWPATSAATRPRSAWRCRRLVRPWLVSTPRWYSR